MLSIWLEFPSQYDVDEKMNNGSNSLESRKKRIKVKKVKIVKKLNENTYSETINGWLYEENGVVYDYDLDFPIGKVKKDENGIFNKLDKSTYIVENLINIPLFKLF